MSTNKKILVNPMEKTGRWTLEEHNLFIQGLQIHGKAWKKISLLVRTRSVVQVRTHAQKYFLKLQKNSLSISDYRSYEDLKFSTNTIIQKKSPVENEMPALLKSFYQQPNSPGTPTLSFPFQTDNSLNIDDFYDLSPSDIFQEPDNHFRSGIADSDYSDVIDSSEMHKTSFDSEIDRDSSVEGLDLLHEVISADPVQVEDPFNPFDYFSESEVSPEYPNTLNW